MNSLILRVMTQGLVPLVLLFSVFLLLRGHNSPGGGFAGGLVAASVFVLHAIVFGVPAARRAIHIHPPALFIWGVIVAVASGLVGPLLGGEVLKAWWLPGTVPIVGHLGTPLLFDVGVYLTVVGAVLTVVFSLLEDG